MTWNDLIDLAFIDLAMIQPGMAITAAMRTDAQTRLNELLSSLSTEGLMAFQQLMSAFTLSIGVTAYTLGTAGSWVTAVRAMRVTGWKASYAGVLSSGGRALSMEEFGAAAAQAQPAGESAPIPKILGADTAYPSINIRVLPPPSAAGTVEVHYWTPIAQITNFGAVVTMPDGWPSMLHYNLAVALAPQYARSGGITQELAANAQNSKASLVAQNAPANQAQ